MSDSSTPSTARPPTMDETLEIQGESVVVHEFRFVEGLRAVGLAKPMLTEFSERAEADSLEPEDLDGVLAAHLDNWMQLLSMSTGRDVEWLASLRDADGLALSLAFWRVNSGFFIRRMLLAGSIRSSVDDLISRLAPASDSSH